MNKMLKVFSMGPMRPENHYTTIVDTRNLQHATSRSPLAVAQNTSGTSFDSAFQRERLLHGKPMPTLAKLAINTMTELG